MSPRPLVRRTPNGTRYIDPSDQPERPRYLAAIPPAQPASEAETAPEPTPPKRSDRPRPKKLTDDEVREILAAHFASKWSQADLAFIYEVSQTTIHAIVHGKACIHVKPAESEEN